MGIVKKQSTVIDGITYTTETLPAISGLVVIPRLVALFGREVLALLFGLMGDAGVDEDAIEALIADPKVLAAIVANVATNIATAQTKEDPTTVLRDVLRTTRADKVDIGATSPVEGSVYEWFDSHFSARYAHLMKVVGWVARVNFFGPSLEKSPRSGSGRESENTISAG